MVDNISMGNDLMSIIHHEAGHALMFERSYANFPHVAAGTWGTLTSAAIQAYYPGDPPFDLDNRQVNGIRVNSSEHFSTGVPENGLTLGSIDPASLMGAFGNEYADTGTMPRRRWIITKLDILAAAAVGLPVRMTMSPFQALHVTNAVDSHGTVVLPAATHGRAYSATLSGAGGVPAYSWTVKSGTLPSGLTLDSFGGTITGTPSKKGSASFTVKLQDSPRRAGRVASGVDHDPVSVWRGRSRLRLRLPTLTRRSSPEPVVRLAELILAERAFAFCSPFVTFPQTSSKVGLPGPNRPGGAVLDVREAARTDELAQRANASTCGSKLISCRVAKDSDSQRVRFAQTFRSAV